MSEISVTGLKDLQEFLDTLPAKVEGNIMRGALRAGAKVIYEQAKQNVPVSSGDLRDSLRVTGRFRDGWVSSSIKAGGKNKNTGADVYYAHMIEYAGAVPHLISVQEEEKPINVRASLKNMKLTRVSMTTINRNVLRIGNTFIGPTVSHPGMRPHPFMRPALDDKADAAIQATAEYIKKRLTKSGLDASGTEVTVEDEG